ncbi:MAG: hypothetical protein WKF91_12785 [Segetibacter sp.]
MKVAFRAFDETGKRVQSVTVKESSLKDTKLYTVCACEREGDAADMLCRIVFVRETANSSFTLHEVMKDYLKVNSPVTPSREQNAVLPDAPATLLTQVTGVDYTFP